MTDQTGPSNGASGILPQLRIGQASSTGRVRSRNEDAVLCEPLDAATVARRGLFCAVADGMGGHAHGEVASAIAVQTARDVYYSGNAASVDAAMRRALEAANRDVFAAGADAPGREQMGSTITAVAIAGNRVVVGHVGDCRCYLFGQDRIDQLTRDHSWVAGEVEAGVLTPQQARTHPRRNIITRALGLQPEVSVDIYRASIAPGGGLVLCSDGLHGLVEDDEILAHVTRLDPQAAADALVALANERGGPDNVSAVVVSIQGAPSGARPSGAAALAHPSERATPVPGGPSTPPPAGPSPDVTPAMPLDTPAPVGPTRADGHRRPSELPAAPRATRGRSSLPRPDRAATRSARPRRRWIVALLLALLLLGTGLGWLLYRGAAEPAGSTPLAPRTASAATGPGDEGGAGAPRSPDRGSIVVTQLEAEDEDNTPAEAQDADEGDTAEDAEEVVGAPRRGPAQLEVVADEAAVRLAPVVGAPVAGVLVRGEPVTGEVEVLAEPIAGDPRWYLVRLEAASPPVRGFVHSSLVRERS